MMGKTERTPKRMRVASKNIRFADMVQVCTAYFGSPRIRGSHHVFRTPWKDIPFVNLQEMNGDQAKSYQVRQVLAAIDKL